MGAIITFIVLLGTLYYGHCVELTQPGSMVLTPGQSLTVSCKVSGYSLTDRSYCTDWIRQPAGKALEWVGEVCGSGNTYYKDSLKNKFTVSRDTSSSTVTLKGSSLQTGDTAVYYCARYIYQYFDYWGNGTQVTVADTPSAPPTLFPLMACGSKGSDHLTLACIASGFSPAASVTFQSTCGMAGSAFTQYPAVQISGSYTSISLVSVKAEERESYSCSVSHSSLKEKMEVSFKKPDQTPCLEVTLNPPKVKELFVNNLVVLDCVITGGENAAVEGARVTWTPSGTDTSSKESQTTPHGHLFRKTSTLTLGREHWFTKKNVECSVQQKSNKPAIKKSFSLNTIVSKVPEVVLITPIKQDSEFVSLVCVVTGFSPWDVFVMWTVDKGSYEEGITSEPVKCYDGTYSVTSFFKVSTAKWESESKVYCNVKHISMPDGAAPIAKFVSKTPETVSALNCNEEGEEEDELGSLWSTTSSFIALFLCTLIYSTLLSLIKMKQ